MDQSRLGSISCVPWITRTAIPAFRGLVENQLGLIDGRIPMYPGIGCTASRSSLSADRVAGQILHARELGAAGFTIFNLSESTARDILPGLKLGGNGPRQRVCRTRSSQIDARFIRFQCPGYASKPMTAESPSSNSSKVACGISATEKTVVYD